MASHHLASTRALDEPAESDVPGAPIASEAANPVDAPRSRRHLLAAAAGSLGALVVGSLVGAKPVEAAAGGPLLLGKSNSAGTAYTKVTTKTTSSAFLVEQTGVGAALYGYASSATGTPRGVYGKIVSPNGDAISATNAATAGGTGTAVRATGGKNLGVFATSDDTAFYGNGGYAGIRGNGGPYGGIFSGTATGAYGSSSQYGVYGVGTVTGSFGSGDTGVRGSGTTYGVYGSGTTGVYGTTADPNANAVLGDGGAYGVHGINGRLAGIRGDSGYVGAWGQGTSYGVYGLATDGVNQTYGVFGQASNSASYAVWAQGNLAVTGTLYKSAGSFKIDHPLDPERKWLSHSFVESPDMMNVYNGVADLDAQGRATVMLPTYFGALNRDYRYQLTAIGAAAPSLHVAREVSRNQFAIAGGAPDGKVSWQVTGIRQDAYAKAHPIVVEEPKNADESGTRLFVPKGSKSRLWLAQPARAAAQAPVRKLPDVAEPDIAVRAGNG